MMTNKKTKEPTIITMDDLPEDIQNKMIELVGISNKSLKTLLKEINELLKYSKAIKGAKGNFKYNAAYAKLFERYDKKDTKPIKENKNEIKESQREINAQIKELKDPNLLMNTINEVHKEGLVGEEDSILIIMIKEALRYSLDAHKPSQNVIFSSKPGFGKDETVQKTLKVAVAEYDRVHKTDLSDKAMLYFSKKYPDWNWDEKVLYLEDPPDDTVTSSSFRTLATGKSESGTVIDKEYVDLKVKGKPVMVVTSYKQSLDIEGERRWGMKHTDESDELSKHVNKEYSKIKSGRLEFKKQAPNSNLRRGLQTKLKSHTVIIPFFDKIKEISFRKNRYFIKNLADYISGCTILHQHQRKKDEQGRLIATFFDWDIGLFLFNQLHNSIDSSLNVRELELVKYLVLSSEPRTISEIEDGTSLSGGWLRNNEGNLIEREIIEITHVVKECGSATKQVKAFSFPQEGEYIELPYSCDFTPFSDDFMMMLHNDYMIDSTDISIFKEMSKKINENRSQIKLKKISFYTQIDEKSVKSVESIEKANVESSLNHTKNRYNIQPVDDGITFECD